MAYNQRIEKVVEDARVAVGILLEDYEDELTQNWKRIHEAEEKAYKCGAWLEKSIILNIVLIVALAASLVGRFAG
jgi:hypothetical protein